MEKTSIINFIKLIKTRNQVRASESLETDLQSLLPLYYKMYKISEYMEQNPDMFSEIEMYSLVCLDHMGDLARETEKGYELRKKEEEFFASQLNVYENLLEMMYGYNKTKNNLDESSKKLT